MLGKLLDPKIVRILNVMLEDEFFHIQQISKLSKVPISSTFRLVNKLAKQGILKIKTIGKFKLYSLADKTEVKKLMELVK